MIQNRKKQSFLFALPVLAVIVFGSYASSNAFAENAFGVNMSEVSTPRSDVSFDMSNESPDTQSEVVFNGTTNGWAIINGIAYPASISLDGNAIHQGNGVWKVASDAKISVGDKDATLELKGKAVNGKLRLHGTGTLDDGDSFRIILRGHYAPIFEQPGFFVVDFSMVKIQNMENGIKIPLVQDGEIHVEPVSPIGLDTELETDFHFEG